MSQIKTAFIVGPTAIGKTAAAIRAAQELNGEIVSADAIQVYRGLEKGSAKPSKEEREAIPHHLIDCVDPDKSGYSVAEYKRLALSCIEDIAERGKLPMVVGGTGLYVNALTFPLDFTAVPPDYELRDRLMREEETSPGYLKGRLRELDPERADKLHENDIKRIVRALEIIINGGKPYSEYGDDFLNQRRAEIEIKPIMIGLNMPREKLYERINKRVDAMMRDGLLSETQDIIKSGADTSLPAYSALGYKQLIEYLTDNCQNLSLDDVVELIKRNTRRFAKRQITWFKRDERIKWLDVSEFESVDDLGGRIAAIINKEIRS